MKKLLFIVAGLMASTAFGAYSASGTLTISGVVLAINELEITPINNTNLNIEGGETARLVGTVSERSNSFTGYKISMSSLNGSKLVNAADVSGNTNTAYTVSYDDNASYVSLTSSAQVVKTVSSLTALTTVSSNVKVNVTAKAGAPAGTYSDTITISIAAN